MTQKRTLKTKIMSWILVVLVVMGTLPVVGTTTTAASTLAYNGTPVTPTKITSSNYAAFGLTESNWSDYNGWYGIRCAEEMYGFAALVNNGQQNANGVLLQDVALNDGTVTSAGSSSGTTYNWSPIGGSTKGSDQCFSGNFDGNGCTISGLYCNKLDTGIVGLFGAIGSYVNIKNIVLSNSYICGDSYVGGIVGVALNYRNSISNCVIQNDVTLCSMTTKPHIGGICGAFDIDLTFSYTVSCSIKNCVNLGKIQALGCDFKSDYSTINRSYIGGITGQYRYISNNAYEFVTVDNCYFLANRITDKNGNAINNYGKVLDWGKGDYIDNASNDGCTKLSSTSDSHTCVTATHKKVAPTCKYPGCSEYTFCLICGKITDGNKTTYSATPNTHQLSNETTCIKSATCLTCGKSFSKNPDNHTRTDFVYKYVNDTKHNKYYACCGVLAKTENHTYLTDKHNSCEHCGTFISKPQTVTANNYESYGLTADHIGYYAISTTKELLWFASLVNGTLSDVSQNQSANAVIINDIDMADYTNFTPIGGTPGLYYNADGTDKGFLGVLDGNRHIIKNLTITGSDTAQLTYGVVGTLSGTVKNLGIENLKFTVGSKDCRAGGVVGQILSGGSVTDCYVVNSTITATGKVGGGIAGCNYGGTVSNCHTYNLTITATRSGGIVGDNRGDVDENDRKGTIENCYTDALTIENDQRTGNIDNCTASVSASDFASGKITYLLNGNSSNGVWKQITKTDSYPKFTGKTVYTYSDCTGTVYYSNENKTEIEHLENVNGFCKGCGKYEEPLRNSDGYYEIDNAGKLYWFASVVNGTLTGVGQNRYAKAKLTANITVNPGTFDENGNYVAKDKETVRAWTPIGNENNQYAGVFNGNGKTVSGLFFNDNTSDYVGLFGVIDSTANVQTVGIINSYFCGKNNVGGIAGKTEGKISNCFNAATVNGTSCVGGITGAILPLASITISGTVLSSYNIGKISGSSDIGAIIGDTDSSTTVSNCYYLDTCGAAGIGTPKTADNFKSGAVTWELNGQSADGVWKQTLGENGDTHPNFTGKSVYAAKCTDGYTNTEVSASGHSYDNGFCTACGTYEPAILNADNYYEISNAGQLYWYAGLVNGTLASVNQNIAANGKLTANITVNPGTFDKDGNYTAKNGESIRTWTPIGNSSSRYNGVFDGKNTDGGNYAVSGLYFSDENTRYVGFFGYINSKGNVKNVNLFNSYFKGKQEVGGIAGINDTGTITNCSNSASVVSANSCAGGIVGISSGKTEICANTGNISAKYHAGGIVGENRTNANVSNCYNSGTVYASLNITGGIVGWNTSAIKNCYNTGFVSNNHSYAGAIVGNMSDAGTVENCFYLKDSAKDRNNNTQNGKGAAYNDTDTPDTEGETTVKTADDFESGEVAWALNTNKAEGVWKQTLTAETEEEKVDKTPNFTGKTVYKFTKCDGKVCYSNENTMVIAHIDLVNGICKKCGGYEAAKLVDGIYEISNAGQLMWFASQVNGGKTDICGKLTKDIDTTALSYIGIGSSTSNAYSGTFDGNGHSIEIKLVSKEQYVAPFLYVSGATIKNLSVSGTITTTHKFAAGIVARVESGNVTLEKCISNVTIDTTNYTDGNKNDGTHGGLVSVVGGGTTTINNCAFTGKMIGTSTTACGGIVGWTDSTVKISNTYVAAEFNLSASSSGNTFSRNPGKATLTNCYYREKLSDSVSTGATQKTADQFASGEVAYLLQKANGSTLVWGQASNSDGATPIPTSDEKYRVLPVVSGNDATVNYTVLRKGDTNGDGKVDVTDYQSVVNIALSDNNTKTFADKYDLNGDGTVDVLDISQADKTKMSDSDYKNLLKISDEFEGLCYMLSADFNGDGVADVLDIQVIEKLLSGHRVIF